MFQPTEDFVPGYAYTGWDSWFTQHLFRGLVRVDEELNLVPDLAEEVTVSDDGLSYRFRLGPDARWSDGVPVSARDFVYGWRRTREERLASGWWLEEVEGANALDERTLEVNLREPRNYFPYLLACPWTFPWPRHRCEALGDAWRDPAGLVGNGPFVLAEFDRERALLLASPTWSGSRGNVGRVEVAFVAEDKDAVAVWRAGDADVASAWSWNAGVTRVLEHGPETVAEIASGLAVEYIAYSSDRSPFDNELVRKAFSHAVDRDRPLGGDSSHALPAGRGGLLPPAMLGHSHRTSPPFDLELARRLLAEAGYPDGKGLPEIELAIPSSVGAGEARDLAVQWRRLGARVLPVPMQSFAAAIESAHAWYYGWSAESPDPEAFFQPMLAELPIYRDEEIIALLGRARALRDQDERMRLFREADRLLVAEQCALLPMRYEATMLLRRPWVHGLRPTPLLGPSTPLDQAVVRR